jgi:streptomycin 6-kinase
MNKLTENVKNIFGDSGTAWIDALPAIIEKLAAHWGLSHIIPVDNMTFNYVAKALSSSNQAVVLKISCDEKSIREEEHALLYFDNHAAIRCLDYNEEFNAMLLQQAVPGDTLKSLYPYQVEFVMDCYVKTMQELHAKPLPAQHPYRHVRDWLKAIDALNPRHLPSKLLSTAIDLRDELLATSGKAVFLHGDLHHDNIINNGSEWLAIDPKGIVGEVEFEIAAFDFIHASESENKLAIKKLFAERVAEIAKKANLKPQRIKDWVFVRLIMAAAWAIEDNCDPAWAISLAESI